MEARGGGVLRLGKLNGGRMKNVERENVESATMAREGRSTPSSHARISAQT